MRHLVTVPRQGTTEHHFRYDKPEERINMDTDLAIARCNQALSWFKGPKIDCAKFDVTIEMQRMGCIAYLKERA